MSLEKRDRMSAKSKKMKKNWASKKRKIEGFFALVADEEAAGVQKIEYSKINGETGNQPSTNFCSNNKSDRPTFYLTEHGLNAQINFTYYNKDKPLGETVAPLFVLDVQQFLLKALLCTADYNFRWGKIEVVRKISHIVLFIVDGLSKDMFIQNVSHFMHTLKTFPYIVEVLTPVAYQLNFATELSGVHLTLGYKPKCEEKNDIGAPTTHHPLSAVFPCPREPVVIKDVTNMNKSFSKLHLLLNPLQLAMENFPLPETVLEGSNTNHYRFTKNVYAHVTPDSPLFALDCEMCRMKSGKSEVIRISLVDEKLNVIYHTLVKPKGHVADYLTKFSGVDREMLLPVKTTLSDVQKELHRLLPPDAILCGQSLNFDLHALQMIHPYIIDTSVIYNMSGRRTKKASLRVLSETFLNEVIQDSEKGHDPTEDCIAAMKLVQLKLKNGPVFGDAILADCKKMKDKTAKRLTVESDLKNEITKIKEKSKENGNTSVENGDIETELSVRFFSKLQNAGKKLCIVTDPLSYPQYANDMVTSSVKKSVETSMKKAIKKSVEVMSENHLTVCHITPPFNQEDTGEVNNHIDTFVRKLYNACADRSLFITIASGTSKKDNSFENALCMIQIKNEDIQL